jgi:hypothetical protein
MRRSRRGAVAIVAFACIAAGGCAAGLPLAAPEGARAGCAEWGQPLMFSGTSWLASATPKDTARSEAASSPRTRQPSSCAPGRQGW